MTHLGIICEKFTNAKIMTVSVSILETHIVMKTGKIYQMDRNEMPLIYASKANPIESFKTLKIYEEIATK